MYGVENMSGVFFAKYGYYKGKKVTVTHRDPKSGQVWLEDYSESGTSTDCGCWVDGESVRYTDEINIEKGDRENGEYGKRESRKSSGKKNGNFSRGGKNPKKARRGQSSTSGEGN